jgi:hypothetical protein
MYLHKVFVLIFLLEGWYGGSKANLNHGSSFIRKDVIFLYFMATLLFTIFRWSKIHSKDCQALFLFSFNVLLVKEFDFPILSSILGALLGLGYFKEKVVLF